VNRILKGQLKKLKLISGSTSNSGLSYYTNSRQLLSLVPVPLSPQVNQAIKMSQNNSIEISKKLFS